MREIPRRTLGERGEVMPAPAPARDLKNLKLFRNVRPSTLAEMNRRCHWFELEDGDVLVSAGERLDRVFFLLQGELRLPAYTRAGKIVSLPPAQEGSMVAGAVLGGGVHIPFSIEAAGPCTIASMSARTCFDIMERDHDVLRAIIEMLAERQRVYVEHIVELSTMSVRSRLRSELVRLCSGSTEADGSAIISPVPTHAELANRIGTHREAVSRELSHLQSIGMLIRRGRMLHVPDVSRLTELLLRSEN